jgi:hypothetical protein
MSNLGQLMTELTGSPLLLVLLVLILITFMYLARSTAHGAIRAFFGGIQSALRLGAQSLMSARERLVQRNKEVLLSLGRESTEKVIEREFQRVNAVVERDLSTYPALHRQLADQIVNIDEDYRRSTDVPPSPPE